MDLPHVRIINNNGQFFCSLSKETLRTALAMGMDRGIHVVIDDKDYANLQPLAVAKLLAKVAEEEKADIVILGKQVLFCQKCLL